MPVEMKKNTEDLNSSVDQSQSISTRGVKRSAKEEENEETIQEKRGRPDENETGIQLHKSEDENQQKDDKTEKKLIEAKEETNDSAHSETSFMDLKDDELIHIFSFLDLPTRLQLRLNKRLDGLHSSVKKKFKKIKLEIEMTQSKLIIDNHTLVRSSNFTEWEQGLCLIAHNAFINWLDISVMTVPNEEQFRLMDALFHFKLDNLMMNISRFGERELAPLSFSSFLTLAQNVRYVCIYTWDDDSSLTADNLCTIRKTMLEGCRMEFFEIIMCGIGIAYLKEHFGVTIEEVSEPVAGTIFHCADDSLEMYKGPGRILSHFESDFETEVRDSSIIFDKRKVVKMPDDEFKIKLNEPIEYEDEEDEEEYEDEEDTDSD